jgi:hypothetical protein
LLYGAGTYQRALFSLQTWAILQRALRRDVRCDHSLKLIVFLLLITIKEPAMAENLTVSDETRSDVAALVAAQDAAWK